MRAMASQTDVVLISGGRVLVMVICWGHEVVQS